MLEADVAVVAMEAEEALNWANLVACVTVGDTAGDGAPRKPLGDVVTIGANDVVIGGY